MSNAALTNIDHLAFGAPGRYLQGPGLLAALGDVVKSLGHRPLVLVDHALLGALHDDLQAGLGSIAVVARIEPFAGECTEAAIAAAVQAGRSAGCDVIVGIGGGKTIDTAKGARIELHCPMVVVPTAASNDAPTSRLVVIYDEQHVLVATRLMSSSPDVVLVDTEIIARAPARFLRAGIGDAISKRFEAGEAVAARGRNFFGGRGGGVAVAIARECYRTIRADAEAALADVASQHCSEALERLVEACVLGSGLGFESGGLSIAHSLLRGFSLVPSLATALHGEQVAVGLLVQLHAMPSPDVDLADLIRFYRRVGLPCTLQDLGCTERLEDVVPRIVERTVRTAPYIGNFGCEVTEATLASAILRAHEVAGCVEA